MTYSVAIVDVGHGNSAVVTGPNVTVVIDAGPRGTLLEYLEDRGITNIDDILLSHADEDHVGGLLGVLADKSISVRRVRANTDSLKGSAIWDDLTFELGGRLGKKVDFVPALTTGQDGQFDRGNLRVEILAPTTYLAAKGAGSKDRNGTRLTSNSLSAVIRVGLKGHPAVLFTGDVDEVSVHEAVKAKADWRAPVLVFPHHGGQAGKANMATFASTLATLVQPSTVVFSIGRGRHETPRKDVVAALRAAIPGVRIACTQLSLHCAKDVPAKQGTHLGKRYAHGEGKRHCCAGTIVVGLSAVRVSPQRNKHLSFISTAAKNALCV